MLTKERSLLLVAGILLATVLLWYLFGQSEIVVLLGIAALVSFMVYDTFWGLKTSRPSRKRQMLQAMVVCIVGTSVLCVLIFSLLKALR